MTEFKNKFEECVLASLGFGEQEVELFDEIQKGFGIEDKCEQVWEAAFGIDNASHFAPTYFALLFCDIVNRMVEKYDLQQQDFSCYYNGACDTHMYFRKKEFTNEEDLIKVLEGEGIRLRDTW